jgi:guanylate kinase
MKHSLEHYFNGFAHPILEICGPSGVGKSTLIRLINEVADKYELSISATTRKQDITQEVHGKHYYFINQEEFLQKKELGAFAETNPYMKGNLYGTPWSEFERIALAGKTPALDIDINGVCQLDKIIPRHKTFRLYLDVNEVEQLRRLENRARTTDTPAVIEKRIQHAKVERNLMIDICQKDPNFLCVVDYNSTDPHLFANMLANHLLHKTPFKI